MLKDFQFVNDEVVKDGIEQAIQPISVYLAGKVGGDKWKLVKDLPTEIAKFNSSDGGNHCEHESGLALFELPPSDMHKDFVDFRFIKQIRNSDILIAYIDHLTCYGTIAEIAYASAIGIQCFVYILEPCNDNFNRNKNRQEEHYLETENPEFDAYWFVCSLPLVSPTTVKDLKEAKSHTWSEIYKQYHRRVLNSNHWIRVKLQAISEAKYRCQLCNAKGHLHVHHRTYENLGNESTDDLIVLCNNCHAKHHDK